MVLKKDEKKNNNGLSSDGHRKPMDGGNPADTLADERVLRATRIRDCRWPDEGQRFRGDIVVKGV